MGRGTGDKAASTRTSKRTLSIGHFPRDGHLVTILGLQIPFGREDHLLDGLDGLLAGVVGVSFDLCSGVGGDGAEDRGDGAVWVEGGAERLPVVGVEECGMG